MADVQMLEAALSPEIRARLMALDHVRDVGIGFKSVGGRMTDELAIIVYVDEKLPREALRKKSIVPPRIDGMPTDIEEDIDARFVRPSDGGPLPADSMHVRPLRSGLSISLDSDHAGTLGFFARRNSDKKPVLVSNYHVLFRDRGLPGIENHTVVQPPIGTENKIAEVGDTDGKIGGSVDCAFAVLNEEGACCCCKNPIPHQNGTDTIAFKGIAKAKVGDIVSKTGRTTGQTFGKIVSIDKNINGPVDYSEFNLPAGSSFTFTTLIMVVKWDVAAGTFVPNEPFAEKGDSGSALVNANGEIVGLHFLSYTSPTGDKNYGFSGHVETVETELGITVPGTRTGLAGGPGASDAQIAIFDNPIDPGTGTVVIGGQSFPAASVNAAFARLEAAVAATPASAAWRTLFEKHFPEVLRHVNGRTRVTSAWHRGKGPSWLAALIRSVNRPGYHLPREVDGVSLATLVMAMGAALLEEGSDELKSAILLHARLAMSFSGEVTSATELVRLICAEPPLQGAGG